jgi:molecular chaperone IbpA|tara:strand:- start:670 stop:1137 length:468 start_codon:yes stop_codon:yes gene_type:complete
MLIVRLPNLNRLTKGLTMTTYDLINFDPFKNFSIGFDRMFDSLNEVSRINTSNFPPYNIRKLKEGKYQVEMALAGFSKSDINCELQDGILTIEAKKEKDSDNLIHQGIASRSVLRKFTLSEYIKVEDADFKDGILKIKLYQDLPEEKKPRTIKIK